MARTPRAARGARRRPGTDGRVQAPARTDGLRGQRCITPAIHLVSRFVIGCPPLVTSSAAPALRIVHAPGTRGPVSAD